MLSKIVQRYLDWRYPAPSADAVRAGVIQEHDEIALGVVRRYSRGNVNLKAGRFIDRPNPRLKSREVAHQGVGFGQTQIGMTDNFCKDAREKFAHLMPYWRDIEEWIKRAEQINGRAVIPAINELRYAARQLFNVQIIFSQDIISESDQIKVTRRLSNAQRYLTNADHDIIDGVIKFYRDVTSNIEEKYGRTAITERYAGYPSLKEKISECEKLIVAARREYDSRSYNYSVIRNEHFPLLISEYDKLLEAEISAKETQIRLDRKLEIAQGRRDILWWSGVTGWPVALLALFLSYFAWTTTYEDFCRADNRVVKGICSLKPPTIADKILPHN